MTQRHIVTLPGHELSNSAARRSKHWIKTLTSVDTTQSNGYAFVGSFAKFDATVEVDEGTWFLSYIEDTSATRLYGRNVTLYQARGGDLVQVETWRLDATNGWALKIRDEIAALIATPAAPNVDALLAEREQLLARLAEIDALLPEPEGTEVSTRQAAQALGVSVRTVQRWAATGKVDARKDPDGRWVVTVTINPAN